MVPANDHPESVWGEFRSSSWTRCDGAGASQPHGDDDQPCSEYWLAWAQYITGDRQNIGHPDQVFRRRFRTRQAAIANADQTWPLTDTTSESKRNT